MEVAELKTENEPGEIEELEKIYTPDIKTIDDLCKFVNIPAQKLCKAVVYQKNLTDEYIIVFIRGDLDVNETKLRNYIGEEIHPAIITEESGIVAGFIGAVNQNAKAQIVFDRSLDGIQSLVCGANEVDYHYKGFNIKRDYGDVEFVDVAKIFEGAICPVCGKKTVSISNGIEIGNIFQLGTKYTKSMDMTYLDRDGVAQNPIMGCYGIGVGRLVASICEESHDDYGPIWPISIAPWQVEICNLRRKDDEVSAQCEKLYDELQARKIEVLYDDRDMRPGSMFADADLFGIPVRAVISPKTMQKGVVEVSYRDKSFKGEIAIDEAADKICEMVAELLKQYDI